MTTKAPPPPELGPPTHYCPACGRPFWSAELYEAHYRDTHGAAKTPQDQPAQDQDVTVANVYRGKNLQIGGAILMVVGALIFVAVIVNDSSSTVARFIGALTAAVGLALYLGGRFEHWYHAE